MIGQTRAFLLIAAALFANLAFNVDLLMQLDLILGWLFLRPR
jgi:hypothetical protein